MTGAPAVVVAFNGEILKEIGLSGVIVTAVVAIVPAYDTVITNVPVMVPVNTFKAKLPPPFVVNVAAPVTSVFVSVSVA